jgi:hypothetical protein
VIYNAADPDTIITNDLDPSDKTLVMPHTNAAFSATAWITLANTGDSLILSNPATATLIDGVSYGTGSGQTPVLGAVGTATAAGYTNNTESGVDLLANWGTTTAATATPAAGNGAINSNFIAQIRSGAFSTPLYRFGSSGDTVPGLGIDVTNGLVTGTISSPTGGFYNVVIERYIGTNVVAQNYTLLVGDSNNVFRIPATKTWTMNTNYTIAGTLQVTGLLDTAGWTLVVSNTLDVSAGTVSNATGLIIYHKLVGGPLPGASTQFNTAPVITAAGVTPSPANDTNDLVAAVSSATDADNDSITFTYQWQDSTNDVDFSNIAFTLATLANTATSTGRYYRCEITPDDTITNGAVFATASVLVTGSVACVDCDSDGLLDSWEVTYFGNLDQTGAGDFDGDGLTNLQEFAAATNPANAGSGIRVISVTKAGDDVLVIWTGGGGTTNIVQAGFEVGSYTDIPSNFVLPGVSDVITNLLDIGGGTNTPARYYRIRLEP